MSTIIECGPGKARVVYNRDGVREVIKWDLDGHCVPAVHTVGMTLVRYPVDHYRHADYGPEVMKIRSERTAQLGWSSTSFDVPLAPEIVGSFNLLSGAVRAAHREFKQMGGTAVEIGYPTMIRLRHSGSSWAASRLELSFTIYLNVAAFEFYHLLLVAAGKYPSSQFITPPIDVSTVPKLLKWLTRFETAKAKLYRENGFDWNPMREPTPAGVAS